MCVVAHTETLRQARRRRKLTQTELEQLTGIGQARLSKYERGHVVPDWATVRRLEQALKLRRGGLLVGDEALEA